MKKLAAFFIMLISLVVIAGCNQSKEKISNSDKKESPEGEVIVKEINKEKNGEIVTITLNPKESEEENSKTENNEKPELISSKSEKENETEEAVTITKPTEKSIETDKSYHVIEGMANTNVAKIKINDYRLSKYKKGDRKWSYIAATSLGTLKKGMNEYTIKALDENGNELMTKTISIKYNGAKNGKLASTGNSGLMFSIFAVISYWAFFRKKAFQMKN